MPYIKAEQRAVLDVPLSDLKVAIAHLDMEGVGLDGVLNYLISTLVADGLHPTPTPWSYADIARAVAVFECAKLEFYRRVAGPKEDVAVRDNGDIFSYAKLPQ